MTSQDPFLGKGGSFLEADSHKATMSSSSSSFFSYFRSRSSFTNFRSSYSYDDDLLDLYLIYLLYQRAEREQQEREEEERQREERRRQRLAAAKRPIPKIIYIPNLIAQQIYQDSVSRSRTSTRTKRKYDDTIMNHSNTIIAAAATTKTTTNPELPSMINNKKKKTNKKLSTSTKATTTVLDKIMVAIRSETPTSDKGVSRIAITKYLKTHFQYDNATALKRALQNGVQSKTLIQTGQSFRIVGDPIQTTTTVQVTIEDLIVGGKNHDDQAKVGDTVTVKYEGKLHDGTIFDSAKSFSFTLGAGDVIKGWDQGIVGMYVGGKRKLFVPSSLGYGKRGSAPDIPPNADLYFVVTLLKKQGSA